MPKRRSKDPSQPSRLPTRKHLRRFDRLFDPTRTPLFYLTVCVKDRSPVLANERVARVLIDAWTDALPRHGWMVGRFVIMPDHVHFFAAPGRDDGRELSGFLRYWKRMTAMRIRAGILPSFAWQREFFDHLMRSSESYSQKWEYVRHNPVRAELVDDPDCWPYLGEIHPL